jgi:hypothetical protein
MPPPPSRAASLPQPPPAVPPPLVYGPFNFPEREDQYQDVETNRLPVDESQQLRLHRKVDSLRTQVDATAAGGSQRTASRLQASRRTGGRLHDFHQRRLL